MLVPYSRPDGKLPLRGGQYPDDKRVSADRGVFPSGLGQAFSIMSPGCNFRIRVCMTSEQFTGCLPMPAVAEALSLPAERQVATLVGDPAGFVSRGLAVLWRERLAGDPLADFAKACELLGRDALDALAALIDANPELIDYRESGPEGRQLIHHAARQGSEGAIRLLLSRGAAVDAPSGHLLPGSNRFDPGATPLLIACESGRAEAATCLLEAGADVAACRHPGGETALHAAAAFGQEALASELIEAGADVDACCRSQSYDDQLGHHAIGSPLHLAALNNRAEIVSLLLKAGAQRDLAGPDGRQALHYAAARGAVAALEVLLAAGADPDAGEHRRLEGATLDLGPLHYAVLNGQESAAAMLLCYGADPLRVEHASGESALQMAERDGDPALAGLLARTVKGEPPGAVFSYLDDQYLSCLPAQFDEMRAFLEHLLSEFPLGRRSLLTLSDWLADMLGPENRPYLARICRARKDG